jgi:hypothetical protein
MRGESPIRLGDELLVEPLLAPAAFVSGDKEDRPTSRIEVEGRRTIHRPSF